MTLNLPCFVGDTVFAYVWNYRDELVLRSRKAMKKRGLEKNDPAFLKECIVTEISITKDNPDPLFTVADYENMECAVFFASEFGKEIFTKEQIYPALADS